MPVNFTGTWHNEHKSQMDITVDNNGVVSGTYQTGVGSPDPNKKHPVTGFASGDLLSFVVHFTWDGTTQSMAAWAGEWHALNKTETITSMWHLMEEMPEAGDQIWYGCHDGEDEFIRGARPNLTLETPTRPSYTLKRK